MGTNYRLENFSEYYIDDIVIPKQLQSDFYDYIQHYNMYDYATIFPYAQESLEELNEYLDIYPCSACVNPYFVKQSGKQFMDKYDFIIDNFPFLDPNKIILTNTKNIMDVDMQLDDRFPNLLGNVPLKMLYDSTHNQNITDVELKETNVVRVKNDWKKLKKVLIQETIK